MNKGKDIALYNKRMLEVMNFLKEGEYLKNYQFLASIEFDKNNLSKVKSGSLSFTAYQIQTCIKLYSINPGFFFIATDEMFK